jgi:hypothetical protein
MQINESNKTVSEEAAAGAAVYSNFLLSIYDLEVLKFELQYIFKCPLHKVIDFFNDNVSNLEVILKNNFKKYSVQTVGSAAFFSGHN